ncbi:efflux RND transporter periplasmic adaptor subunit [Oharaeibacter diazotrophicus]|uniref:RND family efflux transporter MFP subunit n=1 Tax=Oharaeibacter diazotrophicus TaxID=1920512 RepID=A0A4R6R940_9HYPH|nr:efflux RND transporter periplasmic adaptor subunit [Oharaeibacter diazotrophicus]TDP82424.1 RND family efflux transporter MFP subunit [Oharaeibacter diazotrophicus]BBE72813.1 multidrug resistance protein MdtA precursor [Pleomorphomonas sp. SM30]GLS76851.1 membrane protein [Oharaeibacter diazotrophicus]
MRLPLAVLTLALLAGPVSAGSVVVRPTAVPEWKAVYGRVEARDTIPARARIGGTLVELLVSEGDRVAAGQRIATVRDDKIAFQVSALDAQLKALGAQLKNAESDLARAQALVDKGVATAQRLDQLRTQADVYRNQIASTEAQRQVVVQQGDEGAVLAPAAGLVLTVPVTRGAVLMPGETVATVAGGGFFLRLAIPERHAALLREGAALDVETGTGTAAGRLAKVYPQIENGRVVADVEVGDLPTAFVDARLLVRVPIGERAALTIPAAAVVSRAGLDFVKVRAGSGESERTVVVGERHGDAVEVLTGLAAGDEVITP